jgi:hypothetical protein
MTKPRLQISLSPDAFEVVRRLARSQKSPASRIVSELIEEASPMLRKMADTLESMATAAEAHRERIRMTLADSEHEARAAAAQVVRMLDDMAESARSEAAAAADARERAASGRRPPPAPLLSNRGATPHRSRPVPRIATVPATTSDGHKGRALKPRPRHVPR